MVKGFKSLILLVVGGYTSWVFYVGCFASWDFEVFWFASWVVEIIGYVSRVYGIGIGGLIFGIDT